MAGKSKYFDKAARDKVAESLSMYSGKSQSSYGMATREVIASLKNEIESARSKGCTIEEIAQMFNAGGVDIGLSTIKQALRQPRVKKSAKIDSKKDIYEISKVTKKELISKASKVTENQPLVETSVIEIAEKEPIQTEKPTYTRGEA